LFDMLISCQGLEFLVQETLREKKGPGISFGLRLRHGVVCAGRKTERQEDIAFKARWTRSARSSCLLAE
jgi:hypothetical protein